MEDIISQIIDNCIIKLQTIFCKGLQQGDFADIVENTRQVTDKFGADMISHYIQLLDKEVVTSDTRKAKYYVERKDYTKTLQTAMGQILLTRTLFVEKDNSNYVCLVDDLVGLDKYQRIDKGLQAELVEHAVNSSYGKASKLSGNALSRQTVCNKVHSIKEIDAHNKFQIKNKGELKRITKLYVEADEDHISLQDGKSDIVKLVYVHEGKESVCKGRNRLKNAKYFSIVDKGSQNIWNAVSDYVLDTYDTSSTQTILQGDGAKWIKTGLGYLDKAEFVLDKFHVYKSLKLATGKNTKEYNTLVQAIKAQDKKATREVFIELLSKAKEHKNAKAVNRIKEIQRYIINNIDDIDLGNENDDNGCSAEGHISHILSSRMSSRPMGWSKHGASQIAKLKTFIQNGGKVLELIKNKSVQQIAEQLQSKQTEAYLSPTQVFKRTKPKNPSDTYIQYNNNIPILNHGIPTQLYQTLKSLAHKL